MNLIKSKTDLKMIFITSLSYNHLAKTLVSVIDLIEEKGFTASDLSIVINDIHDTSNIERFRDFRYSARADKEILKMVNLQPYYKEKLNMYFSDLEVFFLDYDELIAHSDLIGGRNSILNNYIIYDKENLYDWVKGI